MSPPTAIDIVDYVNGSINGVVRADTTLAIVTIRTQKNGLVEPDETLKAILTSFHECDNVVVGRGSADINIKDTTGEYVELVAVLAIIVVPAGLSRKL